MSNIKVFEDKKIRTQWNAKKEDWYFSVVDVIEALTDSSNPQTYWRVLKKRLKDEGNETVTNCNALKMIAKDGKLRLTDVVNTKDLLRLIQSISSPKAWSGTSVQEYKKLKGLKKENLRDNTLLSRQQKPKTFEKSKKIAKFLVQLQIPTKLLYNG